jgi:flavin reductase (DIM6/NTAB) family NADH-FMN oxidoreductase RutF
MKTLAASHAAADGAVTETVFRRVMASFVTGVTVVTTQVRGEIRGMTANAFMSGSLEPPLCVVSVGKKARMHAFLLESGHFGVNILARGQEALIGHFAGRPVEGIDPKYEYAGDTPLFAHAISSIAAKVTARHECGDHSLFIGHIFALRHSDGRSARRQARVAHAAREDDLADARFLVSVAARSPRICLSHSCPAPHRHATFAAFLPTIACRCVISASEHESGKVEAGFSERLRSNKGLERDDDSKKSHPALGDAA